MYAIHFAPDGEHFQKVQKSKDIGKLWDEFITNEDIAIQKTLNQFAKFRLINLENGKVLGVK